VKLTGPDDEPTTQIRERGPLAVVWSLWTEAGFYTARQLMEMADALEALCRKRR
jgi:hypothetical protein